MIQRHEHERVLQENHALREQLRELTERLFTIENSAEKTPPGRPQNVVRDTSGNPVLTKESRQWFRCRVGYLERQLAYIAALQVRDGEHAKTLQYAQFVASQALASQPKERTNDKPRQENSGEFRNTPRIVIKRKTE